MKNQINLFVSFYADNMQMRLQQTLENSAKNIEVAKKECELLKRAETAAQNKLQQLRNVLTTGGKQDCTAL